MTEKPAYRVPSMEEIEAIPHCGLNAVSTFSGAGGSCLGYRMAGFRVLWASEFVEAAQEVYRLNHRGTLLDTRDIRSVRPQDILDEVGLEVGEIDLLDGSPPCASFSSSGKVSKGWGAEKAYSDKRQRVDDLFHEFARILEGLKPRAFVAENVAGLVRGKAKGYFKEILSRLERAGYRVSARLLDAQWLGVPQTRRRLIFVGVREDLGIDPAHPLPLPYRYTLRDAFDVDADGVGPDDDVEECSFKGYAIEPEWEKIQPGESSERYFNLVRAHPDAPSPTVTQTAGNPGAAGVAHPFFPRKYTIGELKRVSGFPDDFALTGSYQQQWERLGRAVPPVMMARIAAVVRDDVLRKADGLEPWEPGS